MKLYLQRNILLGLLSSVIVVLGLAFISYLYFTRMIEITRWAAHARRVLYHAEQVRSYSVEIETAQRGYGLTGDEIFLEPYNGAITAVRRHLKELDSLTSDNDNQHKRILKLRDVVNDRIAFADEVLSVRRNSFEKAKDLVLTFRGKKLMDEIKNLLDEIQDEENNLITLRSLNARRQFFQFVFAFVGLVVATLVILIVLTYLINSNHKSRTLAEEKMKQAQQDTIKINDELESFTYSVSHDLRAPLRSINGYAQILKEDYSAKLDDEGNRILDVVSKNAKRMGQLIDDLLAFSRLGRQDLRKSMINMNELVRSIMTELLEQNKERPIKLNFNPIKDVLGDASMMRQVWVNLLSNAVKYSQKKEISTIEINCVEPPGSNEVVYSVKDNGAGFDMKYVNKLFGVFHRLHKMEDFEGTGVGLALSKRIIDRHRGRIWAEAKINEGATFYFSMPKK